ncbi:hypothetical protein KKB40_00045 [Patescibacteria group bacterium]|nr:hypothetical protein [Patescibacteria group bacterium]
MVDQTTFYIIVCTVAALILFLAAMVIVYFRLVDRHLKLREDNERLVKIQKERTDIAQTEVQRIIQTANAKAGEIVTGAQAFRSQQEDKLLGELSKLTQIYVNKYHETLVNSQKNISTMLSNIPNNIRGNISAEIDIFRKSMQEEMAKSRVATNSIVEQAVKGAQIQIENHKQARMRQLDESIVEIVEQVSKKVLAKEISIDEHEKLVMKALEEAKGQIVDRQ